MIPRAAPTSEGQRAASEAYGPRRNRVLADQAPRGVTRLWSFGPIAFLLVESVAYPSARLTAFIGASAAPVGEAAVVAGDVWASVPEGPSSGAPRPLGSGVIGGLSSPSPRG